MRGYHGLQPKVWPGLRRRADGSLPDPYAPSSPAYEERMQETETQLAPGMTRVDIGEPIKRLAGEAQPVPVGRPRHPSAPVATPHRPPASPTSASEPRDWRRDYGVAKPR